MDTVENARVSELTEATLSEAESFIVRLQLRAETHKATYKESCTMLMAAANAMLAPLVKGLSKEMWQVFYETHLEDLEEINKEKAKCDT